MLIFKHTQRDHSFITFAKFSEKLTFLTSLICTRTCAYQRARSVSFSENFANVTNERSPSNQIIRKKINLWKYLLLIFLVFIFVKLTDLEKLHMLHVLKRKQRQEPAIWMSRSWVVSDLPGKPPVQVQSLAMRRGELSAVTNQLRSKC